MKHIFLIITLISLSSCHSFNTSYIEIHAVEGKSAILSNKQIEAHANTIKDISNNNIEQLKTTKCHVYMLPAIAETPQFPFDELDKIAPNDTAALSELEKKYIIELREYIIAMKREVHDSYHEYTTECMKTNKKK